MINKPALIALSAFVAIIPTVFAGIGHKPPMAFCKEGTCSDDDDGCPAQITTAGSGYPACAIYDTDTVLDVGDYDAAEGGGYSVFLDVFEPDEGCAVIVKSPASTDEEGCGYIVGNFKHARCVHMNLSKTFMIQQCCGDSCDEATGSPTRVRGLENRRGLGSRSFKITGKDGQTIEPIQMGYPPQKSESTDLLEHSPKEHLNRRKDNKKCEEYSPSGDVYTRPADSPQIVYQGVTGGGDITVSTAREVSQSTSFSAGFNFEFFSAETGVTMETSITDTKSITVQVEEGQTGDLGFTPYLKCTHGENGCGETGEACTGYRVNKEIAGIYAVIATS
ncbi:hypothetical protein ACLMJK_004687 [Lecanora helva]